jgi:hypothetical protein
LGGWKIICIVIYTRIKKVATVGLWWVRFQIVSLVDHAEKREGAREEGG